MSVKGAKGGPNGDIPKMMLIGAAAVPPTPVVTKCNVGVQSIIEPHLESPSPLSKIKV